MSETTIDLETPSGMVLENTAIPREYTARQVVQELIESLNLPHFVDERRVEYSLLWTNQNTTLESGLTLSEAGVASGDRLKLVSSVPLTGSGPEVMGGPGPGSIPGKTDGQEVEVILSVLDLNKSNTELLNRDTRIDDLIRYISKTYKLPDRDEFKSEATYYIKSKALGRVLGPKETLRSADVPNYDRLSILRQEVAG